MLKKRPRFSVPHRTRFPVFALVLNASKLCFWLLPVGTTGFVFGRFRRMEPPCQKRNKCTRVLPLAFVGPMMEQNYSVFQRTKPLRCGIWAQIRLLKWLHTMLR
ncbi:uncharacterized protein DEA37_0001296 [Paragonimus westermani]|uniref:Uncharacterized protein n=1 Tax=Paragonimus westermani TaxID=34504 RepID=A0A5J4N8W5_9TREM|nr:uncharacterized protein DEA37_0001296 [Paragonimus westermani]